MDKVKRLLPDAIEALQLLREAGFLLIMASNQSGIWRGRITHEQVAAVNRRVEELLHPARLDATYISPDGPDMPSRTRKPAPGMLLDAAHDHGIDLGASFMVGDKHSDIAAGQAAGCRTVWLPVHPVPPPSPPSDYTASGLLDAVRWIMQQPTRSEIR